jgi:putative flippase GtrA
MRRLTAQLARFGLVGAFNTGLDFAVTNALFLVFRPEGTGGLMLISIVAVLVAATNSYFMNARWTFESRVQERLAPARFAIVALIGMIVNTAVFLFAIRYLPLFFEIGPVLLVNLGKLFGVAAAMVVTFLGYRLGVFRTAAIVSFRRETELRPAAGPPRWGLLTVVLLLGLGVRLGFWAIAPVVYGDAVSYSWVAWLTAHGRLAEVDTFWHTLFDFWQVMLAALGLDRYQMLVLSTLIPGTLLVVPVYLLGRRLYGEASGMLAALVVALHPRLVEYSVNGFAEMFYLFGATWAVWGLTSLIQTPDRRLPGIAFGLGLAIYLLSRNEALVFFVLLLAFAALAVRAGRIRPMHGLVTGLAVLSMAVFVYVGTNMALWGEHGLFKKSSNLAKQYAESLDIAAAARETYGAEPAPADHDVGLADRLSTLIERWPRNLLYTAERLPGVLLSPIVLFALLLPVLAGGRGSGSGVDEIPLLVLTIWPLLFYPLVQLEPRLLFPTLIGVCIFGAAGLVAFGRFVAGQLHRRPPLAAMATPALAVGVLALLIPANAALAWNSEVERGYHRAIGAWLAENLPAGVAIAGDGYGFVSASTFWAGIRGQPRLWVEDPASLAPWARANGYSAILLYEPFIRAANPQLLGALEEGVPGLHILKRFDFERIGRVAVLALPELKTSR